MMYGWTREYILNNLSFQQIDIFYVEGMQYDLYRHGCYKIYEDDNQPTWEELRQELYTEKERREQEKYLQGKK